MQEVCGEKLTMYCQENKKQKNKNKSEDRERRKRMRESCQMFQSEVEKKSEKIEDKEESGYTCVEEKKQEKKEEEEEEEESYGCKK